MQEKRSGFGSALRVIAIILVSVAAAFTLLGGAGTSCVAFAAEKFGDSMAKLVPAKPIFQVLVVISLAAGIYGVLAIVKLVKGKPGSVRSVLIFLLVGGIASGVQYYYSLTLRGSTAPNNIRLYATVLALVVMLILQLPGLREKVDFERGGAGGGKSAAGGAALLLSGLLILTTSVWAAPTHVIDGYNTANELFWPLIIIGALCASGGAVLLSRVRVGQVSERQNPREAELVEEKG